MPEGADAVVGSRGSGPAITVSTAAASATERARTPTVSKLGATGSMPARLTRPQEGRTPTTPQNAAGQRSEPSVSVASAAATSPAETAAAEPELPPPGDRSRACGLSVSPPRGLQPLTE